MDCKNKLTTPRNTRPTCFFCKFEIIGTTKYMKYKKSTVKVCTSCGSSKYKMCNSKHKATYLDCNIYQKGVLYNASILCLNCDHWIHKKCTNLSAADIKIIENNKSSWYCAVCHADIFPFSQLNSTKLGDILNQKPHCKNNNIVVEPILDNQCFLCKNQVPRCKYRNKRIIYNSNKGKICLPCSIDNSKFKNANLVEYLDCSMCMKEVENESIFCSACQHWVHADCAQLSRRDMKTMDKCEYGDWFCLPCSQSIFPCFPTYNKLCKQKSEFNTHNECSSCLKVVKGESLCCSLCRHWVHKKCIGKFSNKRKNKSELEADSFENMNNFYRDKDWFCYSCSMSIFPFCALDGDDFDLACHGLKVNNNKNFFETNYKKLFDTELFTEINKLDNTSDSELDKVDPDQNIHFNQKCSYITSPRLDKSDTPEISVLNFNIRSIRKNFEAFSDLLGVSNNKFDVITLTETWMDTNSNIEDFSLPGYHPPIAQNRGDRPGGGVLIYLCDTFESYRLYTKHCHNDTYNNILTVSAYRDKVSYCISACYRSPSSENASFLDNFEKMVSGISNLNSIITGDFNYNLFNMNVHAETESYYNTMTSNSFRTVITKPTRISDSTSTLIDHIWINDMSNDKIESKIILCDITDHLPTV